MNIKRFARATAIAVALLAATQAVEVLEQPDPAPVYCAELSSNQVYCLPHTVITVDGDWKAVYASDADYLAVGFLQATLDPSRPFSINEFTFSPECLTDGHFISVGLERDGTEAYVNGRDVTQEALEMAQCENPALAPRMEKTSGGWSRG